MEIRRSTLGLCVSAPDFFIAAFANWHYLSKAFRHVIPTALLNRNRIALCTPRVLEWQFWIRLLRQARKIQHSRSIGGAGK
jgi:hypothetical protein